MAHRLLTDSRGGTWQVWAVRPTPRTAAHGAAFAPAFAPAYRDGWLAFERLDPAGGAAGFDPEAAAAATPPAAPEKRRHAPIPPGWEDAPDAALLAWLSLAVPVVRRPAHPAAAAGVSSSAVPPQPMGPPPLA